MSQDIWYTLEIGVSADAERKGGFHPCLLDYWFNSFHTDLELQAAYHMLPRPWNTSQTKVTILGTERMKVSQFFTTPKPFLSLVTSLLCQQMKLRSIPRGDAVLSQVKQALATLDETISSAAKVIANYLGLQKSQFQSRPDKLIHLMDSLLFTSSQIPEKKKKTEKRIRRESKTVEVALRRACRRLFSVLMDAEVAHLDKTIYRALRVDEERNLYWKEEDPDFISKLNHDFGSGESESLGETSFFTTGQYKRYSVLPRRFPCGVWNRKKMVKVFKEQSSVLFHIVVGMILMTFPVAKIVAVVVRKEIWKQLPELQKSSVMKKCELNDREEMQSAVQKAKQATERLLSGSAVQLLHQIVQSNS